MVIEIKHKNKIINIKLGKLLKLTVMGKTKEVAAPLYMFSSRGPSTPYVSVLLSIYILTYTA